MDRQVNPVCKVVVTVDVEDWPQSTWDRSLPITQRAANNTSKVLDLLEGHKKRVTMFVLGKFAERFPDVVKRIVADRHELASHGYGHVEIFKQTTTEFREDAYRAKCLLEDIAGKPVIGYRAPDFSVVPSSTWALGILAELGFEYDSSIFPIRHRRYGISTWPTYPVRVNLNSGRKIVELPIATMPLFKTRLPVGGGGYHRLLPSAVIRRVITYVLREGYPFTEYCHPYEFDPKEFEEIELDIPLRVRLHQCLGRKGFQMKFEHILAKFEIAQARHVCLDFVWPDYKL